MGNIFADVKHQDDMLDTKSTTESADTSNPIPDIENIVASSDKEHPRDFDQLHKDACDAKQTFYDDPDTGFKVFTKYAHLQRGQCCGSGCRHCPYNHENVQDKAQRIQQAAFLHQIWDDDTLFSLSKDHKDIKVLFHSGGKDSFLTIRALVKQSLKCNRKDIFSLILLTTFDAKSRIIAHQEISINTIINQSKHLQISLVGVPMHRGSSETYVDRIKNALELIQKRTGKYPSALVFGDLHLDHIRNWRNETLGKLEHVRLEYPLWKVSYDVLMEDLESSGVIPMVSASDTDGIDVGMKFTKEFSEYISSEKGIDAFGENGEFHTCVEVWRVGREQALGLV